MQILFLSRISYVIVLQPGEKDNLQNRFLCMQSFMDDGTMIWGGF